MLLSCGRIGCGIDNGLALAQACLRMSRYSCNQHEPAHQDSTKNDVFHYAAIFTNISIICKCSHIRTVSCGVVHHTFVFLLDL